MSANNLNANKTNTTNKRKPSGNLAGQTGKHNFAGRTCKNSVATKTRKQPLQKRNAIIAAGVVLMLAIVGVVYAIATTSNVKYDEYAPVVVEQNLDKEVLQDTYITIQFEEVDENGDSYDPARTYREAFKFAKGSKQSTKTVMLGVYKYYKITQLDSTQFSNWRYTHKTASFANAQTATIGGNDVWTPTKSGTDETLPATLKIGTVDKPSKDRKLTLNSEITNEKWVQDTIDVENTIDCSNYFHITFDSNGHGTSPTEINVAKDATVSTVKTETALATEAGSPTQGLKLEGWYKESSCTNKVEIGTTAITQDMTLYANWVPTDDELNTYWIAPASKYVPQGKNESATSNAVASGGNYVSETTNILKSSAEIQADVQKMINGDEDTINFYTTLMKEDKYHLYTKYKGTDATQDADKYLEARIINVGAHQVDATEGNNDNSILTFQAIHAMPTALAMNSADYNDGGWANCDIRETINNTSTGIASTSYLNSAFINAISSTKKVSYNGASASEDASGSYTITYDKFWVISSSEILASVKGAPSDGKEGVVYGWYADRAIGYMSNNGALASFGSTRNGDLATGADYKYSLTRTPYLSATNMFKEVSSGGALNYAGNASSKYAYAPCFSFGKAAVTFDMQGHGDQVEQQVISNKQVSGYTDADITGYEQADLTFAGWYDNAACSGDKIDFTTKEFTTSTTVYARWNATDNLKTTYWIAPSYRYIPEGKNAGLSSNGPAYGGKYINETTNILKTSSEIQEDVAKIRKGDLATIAYYNKIVKSDKYHLYTKIADTSNTNDYMECRILEVGAHSNGDANDTAALTFQAIHALPSGYKYNTSRTTVGGWDSSNIRNLLNNTDIYAKFKDGFKNDVETLPKLTSAGEQKTDITTSNDKFWLLSSLEISGQVLYGTAGEGTEYAFWANHGIGNGSNEALKALTYTRSGGSISGDCGLLRSPSSKTNTKVARIYRSNGSINNYDTFADEYASAVAPAFAFGGTSYKVTFNMNGHGNQIASKYVKAGATLGSAYQTGTNTDAGTVEGLKLEGWYTSSACLASQKVTATTAINTNYTLYANWVPDTDADKYWISPSYKMTTGTTADEVNQINNDGYVKEEWNVKKSYAEIQADVLTMKQELAAGKDTTTANSVLKEYNDMMKSDAYHLYTKWGGSTADTGGADAKNGYVEARIINVGEHDSDGSVLTFEAVSQLAQGFTMATTKQYNAGWQSTLLYAEMNSGSIWTSFKEALRNDLLTVPQTTAVSGTSTDTETVDNKMFVLSLSELTGNYNNAFTTVNEGSQYGFYSNLIGSFAPVSGTNYYIYQNPTRAGKTQAGYTGKWCWNWVRTPSHVAGRNTYYLWRGGTGSNYGTINVTTDGSNVCGGVLPAFAMGGHMVTFNSQSGSSVDPQLLKSKTTATRPTDPTRDGYVFKGWYKDSNCSTGKEFNFADTTVTGDITLFAKWENVTDSYWLNYADAENPEDGVLKTRDEIQMDVAKITAGNQDVIDEYKGYMGVNEDGTMMDMSKEVHLYTKLNTNNSGDSKNDYAEFRLIQVRRSDSDPLTWQMTHVLPTAYQMDDKNTTTDFANTDLATSISSDSGAINQLFASSIKEDAIKKTFSGWSTKLYILSAREIYGTSAEESGICTGIGTKFTYYDENYRNVTKSDETHECLAYRTRAGGVPTGQSTEYSKYHEGNASGTTESYVSWWLRDNCAINSADWCRVYNDGRLDHESTTSKRGVAVAFTMAPRVVMDTQGHGGDKYTLALDDNKKVTPDGTLNGTSTGLTLEGWYDNAACYGTKIAEPTTISSALDSSVKTLYANWIPTSNSDDGANSYWIAPAYNYISEGANEKARTKSNDASATAKARNNYVSEEWNVLKSSTEIKNDVEKIKNGDEATIEEYTTLMKEDKYHLYTKYTGGESTASYDGNTSALNGYVEFRIIEVGAHSLYSGGADGSTLTFMATHSLPTTYVMNTTDTSVGGWAKCSLRTVMQSGEIYNKFKTSFKNDITSVSKESGPGGDTATTTSATNKTTDALWLCSFKEFVGDNTSDINAAAINEGMQYAWFADRTIAGTDTNNLFDLGINRAGKIPGSNDSAWGYTALRSAVIDSSTSANYLTGVSGYLLGQLNANSMRCVAPCFAF